MGDMADYYDDRDSDVGIYHGTGLRPRRYTPKRKARTMATPKKLTPAQKVRVKEAALDANLTLQQTLKAEEAALRADIRLLDVPPAPPESAGDMFRVIIRFSTQGPNYTYLLARVGDRWYTTGTVEDQKVFASWEKLCEWINSTAWHSHVERLQVTGKGSWITEHEMPF
jgi:hypothetical protein